MAGARGPATARAALLAVLALPVVLGLVVPALLIVVDPWRQGLEGPSLAIGIGLVITGGAMVSAQSTRAASAAPAVAGSSTRWAAQNCRTDSSMRYVP